jgi:hypothetical protein
MEEYIATNDMIWDRYPLKPFDFFCDEYEFFDEHYFLMNIVGGNPKPLIQDEKLLTSFLFYSIYTCIFTLSAAHMWNYQLYAPFGRNPKRIFSDSVAFNITCSGIW